jgi:hypothetical protein
VCVCLSTGSSERTEASRRCTREALQHILYARLRIEERGCTAPGSGIGAPAEQQEPRPGARSPFSFHVTLSLASRGGRSWAESVPGQRANSSDPASAYRFPLSSFLCRWSNGTSRGGRRVKADRDGIGMHG